MRQQQFSSVLPALSALSAFSAPLAALLLLFPVFFPSPAAADTAEPDPHRLPDLVVSGSSLLDDAARSRSRSIISRRTILGSGAQNVAELLASQEGVHITRYGGSGQATLISMRGLSGDRVEIQINGLPVGSAGSGADLDTIPLENVERVEIIRGGSSADSGNGSLSGVVNIITRSSSQSAFHPEIQTSYGSYKSRRLYLALPWAPSSHLRMRTFFHFGDSAGNYLFPEQISMESDGSYELAGERVPHLNTGHRSLRAGIRSTWQKGAHKLRLFSSWKQKNAGVPGTIEFPTLNAAQEDENLLAMLKWNWQYNTASVLRLEAGYISRNRLYQDFELFEEAMHHESRRFRWQLTWENTSPRRKFRLHAHQSYDTLDSSSFAINDSRESGSKTKASRLSTAVGASCAWLPGPNPEKEAGGFLIEGKARLEYSRDKMILAPESGMVLALADTGRLLWKSRLAYAYRRPDFMDLFWPETFFAAGNPDLKPEHGWNLESSLEWKPGGGLQASAALYQNTLEDMIVWQPSAGGVWRPSNVASARIRGLETSLQYQLLAGKKVSLLCKASYSLQKAENTTPGSNQGNQLARQPLEKADSSFLLGLDWFTANLGLQYTGFRFLNQANTKYLGDYLLFNISLQAHLFKRRLRVKVSIQNLFDTAYIHLREYPVPGREMDASLHWQF